MIISTWNVNSLTARWPRVEAWLLEKKPDVLLVQETKQNDAKFPFGAIADLDYEAAHYGQGQWNGVAVLSRVGLEDVARGFGDDDPEARIIGATCAGVRVYSCYVPNGRALDDPHYAYKLRWLAQLRELVERRDLATPLVVGGDFNVAPSDLDCYDPSLFVGATHVSGPERESLRALEATGLVDLTRALNPDEPCYSCGTIETGPSTGAGGCALTCSTSTGRCVSARRRVTSTATRARARSPRTTRRWSESSPTN